MQGVALKAQTRDDVETPRWPAIILAVVLYLVGFVGAAVLGMVVQQGGRKLGVPAPWGGLLTMGVYVSAACGLVLLVRRKVEHRPFGGLGLQWDGAALRLVATGVAAAIAMYLAFVALAVAAGWAHVTYGPSLWTGAALPKVADSLFLFVSVAVAEELVFRGALPSALGARLPLWAATAISGVLFGVLHAANAGFTSAVVVSALAVTFLLMVSRLLTGSLWWAVGWHLAWDWSQQHLVALTPEGSANALVTLDMSGPVWLVGDPRFIEGGALVIAIEVLAALALLAWAHRTGRAPRWGHTLD